MAWCDRCQHRHDPKEPCGWCASCREQQIEDELMTPPMRGVLVRMPRQLLHELRAHAKANDRTMAATVRRAVRDYLKDAGV